MIVMTALTNMNIFIGNQTGEAVWEMQVSEVILPDRFTRCRYSICKLSFECSSERSL